MEAFAILRIMSGRAIPFLALLAAVVCAASARADEIRLKDGTKISGTIVGFENDSFRVETSYGFALVLKDKVDGTSFTVRGGGYSQGGGSNQRAQLYSGCGGERKAAGCVSGQGAAGTRRHPGLARQPRLGGSVRGGDQSMIPKSMPSDLIRGWTPVFGKDHAQKKRRF